MSRSRARTGSFGFALLLLVGCGGESTPASGNGSKYDAGNDAGNDAASLGGAGGGDASAAGGTAGVGVGSDAAPEGGLSCDEKSQACATEFGSLFTKSNGRADGTLVALVRPADTQCTLPNSTHVVLQLSIQNQVQRLVASVDGVAVATHAAPLLGPAYAEGWHENVPLEYATDLGVHSTDLSPVTLDEAVAFLCDHLEVGAPVSVYAYSDGTLPASAHQIHSNDNYPDGAIVVDPTSATPTYLLFRYLDQVF